MKQISEAEIAKQDSQPKAQTKRGMAIVMVLVIITLLMGLVLAMLSMGSSEARSSSAFSQASQARDLAEMPLSVIMGQIREATSDLKMSKTWASQPGMIRVFGTAEGTVAGRSKLSKVWRLYSSEKMTEGGDSFDATKEAALLEKWKESPAQFTDLNEPVATISADGKVQKVHPILDGKALTITTTASGTTEGVAGFGLASNAGAPGGSTDHQLPMPVRWLYVLRDGKMVVPTGGTGSRATFKSADVNGNNPIVGRIAFWTDDESCKVNLNTAGEGTGWDVPRTTGWTDRNFAYFMPAQNEFQRFPGHPAMTSMSTVLQAFDTKFKYQFPQIQEDGTVGNKDSYQAWLSSIYDLLPRVHLGTSGQGSRGGSESATSPSGLPLKRDRLFASVDEFIYGTAYDATKHRREPNSSDGAVNAADLETSRFFLTAHSRAPEVNLYNRPRISLWPVQAEASKRTAKDKLLAYCATYADDLGAFQRASTWENDTDKQGSSQSPTADFQLPRNQKLFGYLQELTKKGVPGFGSPSFDDKYGSLNRNQILLEMFDFVRWGVNASNPYDTPKYHYLPPRAYTELNPDHLAEASAVPVVATGTATESFNATLRGFGRFPTVVEAALVFMATEVKSDGKGNPIDISAPSKTADKTMRMRAFLVLQPFTPVVGTPPYSPHVRYRIKGMEDWHVNGSSLGFPDSAVNRVWVPAGDTLDGGHATAYTSLQAQFYKARGGQPKSVLTTGEGEDETASFPFVSEDVDVSTANTFTFSGGPITIETHLGAEGPLGDNTLIQTARINFHPASAWPVPTVRVQKNLSSNSDWSVAKSFMHLQSRFDKNDPQNFLIVLGDTVRSMVVDARSSSSTRGDYRLLCGLHEIPESYFKPHPGYGSMDAEAQSLRHAGSGYTGHYGKTHTRSYLNNDTGGRQHTWQAAGYVIDNNNQVSKSFGLLQDVRYWQDCQPTGPPELDGAFNANDKPGDWDTGPGRTEDGPYINKPDDTGTTGKFAVRNGYFARNGFTEESTGRYYSPNRQICSAVAFGSLPSGIHPIPKNNNQTGPWQTLLFCPNPPSRVTSPLEEPTQADHWGFRPPRDHLLLDFFWMPVVEPYAISEPLSTAGKINLNTQIMPFTYIRRETGIHAALRSVRLNALPYEVAWASTADTKGASQIQMLDTYKAWRSWMQHETMYQVNAEETMKGMRRRFAQGDIFRSASEICDIFLVPQPIPGRAYYPRPGGLPSTSPKYEEAVNWWNGQTGTQQDGFELTGDNVRESPYNQLYPRLTTKSNVFTVHYRVQVLKKARSSPQEEWDEMKDLVASEYRGSTILERYIDPNASGLPDFFGNPAQAGALDDHYRFRVILKKKFAP